MLSKKTWRVNEIVLTINKTKIENSKNIKNVSSWYSKEKRFKIFFIIGYLTAILSSKKKIKIGIIEPILKISKKTFIIIKNYR